MSGDSMENVSTGRGLLVYIFRGPSRLSNVNQHSLMPGQMSLVRSSSCSWARALGSKHVWARTGTGPYTCWQNLTLAAILSSLALDFINLALVADSNLFRHEPNFDIQTALRSKLDWCLLPGNWQKFKLATEEKYLPVQKSSPCCLLKASSSSWPHRGVSTLLEHSEVAGPGISCCLPRERDNGEL